MRTRTLVVVTLLLASPLARADVSEAIWASIKGKHARLVLKDNASAEGEVLGGNDSEIALQRGDGEVVSIRKNTVEKVVLTPLNAGKNSIGSSDFFYCDYSSGELRGSIDLASQYSESSDARDMVKEISRAAGVVPRFVVRPGPVPNAAAVIQGYDRYLLYNPSFMEQVKTAGKTNWAVYSVVAHELGHHLNGHTITPQGSRPDLELEADEFSGFILAAMGASLENAQRAMKSFGSDAASSTHPARSDRLKAIESGWKEGKRKGVQSSPKVSEDAISESIDAELAKDKGKVAPPQPQQPSPNSAPPTVQQVAPPGSAVMSCGCYGPIMPGTTRFSQVCASGREVAVGCTGVCVGGGVPWTFVCQ